MQPISSSSTQPSRKEWRVVSEQSVRNSGDEGLERSKLGQSDERLIYEVHRGREPVDVDFCSITIDGGLDNDILQQRLLAVAKQREELQQMEIELRAQAIARSEIMGMQNTFDTQMKEHANANVKLQEQLHEKEQKIHELERTMEEKERELHAIRLDTEAAWAKDDLLREQSKELQSYRRERDNSEAERVQHIKQIHDFQEHIQEKDRLFMELQEQHRIAQETILFKDEQLREAQAWITRAQEMDALQSTTNHTLQAELRERTEHYNQLWLGCQRQFAEMERLHLHIQQLQLELADVREKSGSNLDGSHTSQTNLENASELGKSNVSQLEVNGNASESANSGVIQSGNSDGGSGGNTSTQGDHVHVVAYAPSLLGMPTYAPTGQVAAMHPFVMHQQGVQHPSHVLQSHFHPVSAMPSTQNWQNQQPDGQHVTTHNQYPQETEQNMLRTDSHYDYETSENGQILHADYVDTNISQGLDADSVSPSANGEVQGLDSIDKTYDNTQSPQGLQQISSQFHDALPPANAKSFSETTTDTASSADLADTLVAAGQKNNTIGKPGDSYLLDERALLASIARTLGSGGRIRISTTLPNRLAKMLAPLHWHDYKKKYGKLDDFVASHPEVCPLFPLVPSVAVTPMAQSHRPKKESSYSNGGSLRAAGGSNVKILSKSKDHLELNGSGRPGMRVQLGNNRTDEWSKLVLRIYCNYTKDQFAKLQMKFTLRDHVLDNMRFWNFGTYKFRNLILLGSTDYCLTGVCSEYCTTDIVEFKDIFWISYVDNAITKLLASSLGERIGDGWLEEGCKL
ncbi:hypothetical protein DH2020_047784 [Rehmannia glutinosa]|uniref:DUF7725 domain-containing protein n=1 Tax=Rehmannia glutinosa TaxID=99300 RepID=A0ABR0U7X5_REHGL